MPDFNIIERNDGLVVRTTRVPSLGEGVLSAAAANMETLIEGSRVRFGSVAHDGEKGGKEYFFKVSFPDASALTST
jgi:hypothetical protein